MPSSNPMRRHAQRATTTHRPLRHRPIAAEKRTTPTNQRNEFRGRFELVAFCLALLVFMIAIGRPEWFELRPATGSSVAMYNASQTAAPKTPGN